MTYLFTKEGCGKCDWVKSKVDLGRMEDVNVMTLGEDNPEALAMLAYFECVGLSEKKLPILVSDAGDVITGAVHIKNHLVKNFC
jgi:hypothetical protein